MNQYLMATTVNNKITNNLTNKNEDYMEITQYLPMETLIESPYNIYELSDIMFVKDHSMKRFYEEHANKQMALQILYDVGCVMYKSNIIKKNEDGILKENCDFLKTMGHPYFM